MIALSAGALLADSDKGRGSPIGLFVILALCVAVYFLWKSLNRHLKKVPDSFDGASPMQTNADTDPRPAEPNQAPPDPAGAPAPPSEPQS